MAEGSIIAHLPCGCVADFSSLDEMVECPWCGATFARDELVAWASGYLPPFFAYSSPKPLLRLNDDVSEVVRFCHCGCGAPLVRMDGVVLKVSPDNLQWARN